MFPSLKVVVESLIQFKIRGIDPGEGLELMLPCIILIGSRSMETALGIGVCRHFSIKLPRS